MRQEASPAEVKVISSSIYICVLQKCQAVFTCRRSQIVAPPQTLMGLTDHSTSIVGHTHQHTLK